VGIVFAPTLNIPAPVFSMFLTEFDGIFTTDPEDSPGPVVEVTVTAPQQISMDDIRSPRRQMFQDLSTPSYNQSSFPMIPAAPPPSFPMNTGQTSRAAYESGFISLQPSYEHQFNPYMQGQQPISSSAAGMEYGSLNNVLTAPDHGQSAKQRRRESSMLMGMGMANKKNGMPRLKEDKGMTWSSNFSLSFLTNGFSPPQVWYTKKVFLNKMVESNLVSA